MRFIKNLSEKEYQKFWEQSEYNHFMQSYEWGKACEKNRGYIPCYVGLMTDNGQLVATALLLKKKTPLNMCYFYSPRGFTMDYQNKEIVTEFTKELRKYLKEENILLPQKDIALRFASYVDPIMQKIQSSREVITNASDARDLILPKLMNERIEI